MVDQVLGMQSREAILPFKAPPEKFGSHGCQAVTRPSDGKGAPGGERDVLGVRVSNNPHMRSTSIIYFQKIRAPPF